MPVPRYIPSGTDVMEEGNTGVEICAHPANALAPIDLTALMSGRESVSRVEFSNADAPIFVTVAGRATDVTAQSLNAPSPTSTTV